MVSSEAKSLDTGSPAKSKELNLTIFMGPFQLETFSEIQQVKMEKVTNWKKHLLNFTWQFNPFRPWKV